jgi:hypothetical protein
MGMAMAVYGLGGCQKASLSLLMQGSDISADVTGTDLFYDRYALANGRHFCPVSNCLCP